MCASKNYPYLPHERDFSLNPPPTHPPTHLSANSSQASCIHWHFWAFENPPAPRNFQSLLWGSMFSGTTQYNHTCILAIQDLQFYQCDDWTIMLLRRRNYYPPDQWTNYLEAAFGSSQFRWVWVWLCVHSSRVLLLIDFFLMSRGDSLLDPLKRKFLKKRKKFAHLCKN